jgi:quercetin dioxygenase-like cupin family protein
MKTDDTQVHISMIRAEFATIDRLIAACLPRQGSIEIQQDQEGKEHAWHTHPTDETIVMLEGALRFYWADNEVICGPGDVIYLPKGTRHGSIGLKGGAKYIITFETVSIGA